jgi:nucleotide-binding universal stress UspA family protein
VTLVVGHGPQEHGRGALCLGAMLARSGGDDLVVATIVPKPWVPGPARVDAEYRAYLDRLADEGFARARAILADDVRFELVRHEARSVAAGLLELAEQTEARLLAIASTSAGSIGRVALGSTADRLLHGSPIPVALAPRGLRCDPDDRVRRVTAAYGGPEGAEDLVVAGARVASEVGATLRIATFAVWARPDYTTWLGSEGEDQVLAEWLAELRTGLTEVLEKVEGLRDVPRDIETVIGHGQSWADALEDVEWTDEDVLTVGSSSVGPVARVFLGTRSSKIVRYSPVPVVVVPRERAVEIAGAAEAAE